MSKKAISITKTAVIDAGILFLLWSSLHDHNEYAWNALRFWLWISFGACFCTLMLGSDFFDEHPAYAKMPEFPYRLSKFVDAVIIAALSVYGRFLYAAIVLLSAIFFSV